VPVNRAVHGVVCGQLGRVRSGCCWPEPALMHAPQALPSRTVICAEYRLLGEIRRCARAASFVAIAAEAAHTEIVMSGMVAGSLACFLGWLSVVFGGRIRPGAEVSKWRAAGWVSRAWLCGLVLA
jgi:hypothetical protein